MPRRISIPNIWRGPAERGEVAFREKLEARRLERRDVESQLQGVQGQYDLLFAVTIACAPACLVGAVAAMDVWAIMLLLISGVVFTVALVLSRGLERVIQAGRQNLEFAAAAAREERVNEAFKKAREEGKSSVDSSIYAMFNSDFKEAYRSLWKDLVKLDQENWRWATYMATAGILLLLVAVGLQVIDVRRAQEKERAAEAATVCGRAPQPAAGIAADPRGRR
jgi:hypothetical protein